MTKISLVILKKLSVCLIRLQGQENNRKLWGIMTKNKILICKEISAIRNYEDQD